MSDQTNGPGPTEAEVAAYMAMTRRSLLRTIKRRDASIAELETLCERYRATIEAQAARIKGLEDAIAGGGDDD